MNVKKLLDIKVPLISVDIDINCLWDVRDFLLSLVKVYRLFNEKDIEIHRSPSGLGYHILIFKENNPIENFLYRAYLKDDPYRLRFAMDRVAITLLNNTKTLPVHVDLVYEAKRYSRYGKSHFIRKAEINVNKIRDWVRRYKEEPNKVFHEIIEYIDDFIVEQGIQTRYVVYGKVKERDFKIFDVLKKGLEDLGYKAHHIEDPYDSDYRLVKVIVKTKEDVEKVISVMKKLGITRVWFQKRLIKS